MLKNYLKLAWRNLTKNKSFSAINIVGLSIGLTCCILITLYVQHELSYDKFQANGKKIARVIMEYSIGGAMSKGNYTSTKVAPAFKQNFPEVVAAVRMSKSSKIIRHGEKHFTEKTIHVRRFHFFQAILIPGFAREPRNCFIRTKCCAAHEIDCRKILWQNQPGWKYTDRRN